MKKITKLTDKQVERYSRQIILEKIETKGQLKIMNSKILILGCGGLGTTAATYLAMAGVNSLGILDFDNVSLSNLNRQLLFYENDIGKKKVDVLSSKLRNINSKMNIDVFPVKLNSKNYKKFIKNYDYLLDCTDNFKSRYLINDICVENKKILVSAALYNFEIQVFAFKAWSKKKFPCYRCIFPFSEKNLKQINCNEMGILSSVAGIGGTIQANTVLNIILDESDYFFKNFVIYNTETNTSTNIAIEKDIKCRVCKI